MPTVSEEWWAILVEKVIPKLVDERGTVTSSPYMVKDYMTWLARSAYEKGRTTARLEMLTAIEVAETLGVDRSTVFRRARRLGLGWQVGRDRLFWPEDVERMA